MMENRKTDKTLKESSDEITTPPELEVIEENSFAETVTEIKEYIESLSVKPIFDGITYFNKSETHLDADFIAFKEEFFVLTEQLASNQTSEVHLVIRLSDQKPFVLKTQFKNLNTDSLDDEDDVREAKARKEYEILSLLNSANTTLGWGIKNDIENGSKIYLTLMPYVEGNSLENVLIIETGRGKKGKFLDRPFLPAAMRLKIAKGIVEAIDALHEKKILHCDIKPANFIVDREGNITIIDFNFSEIGQTKLETKEPRGTIIYLAPELWATLALLLEGDQSKIENLKFVFDEKTEVYSMGITLAQLFNLIDYDKDNWFEAYIKAKAEASEGSSEEMIAFLKQHQNSSFVAQKNSKYFTCNNSLPKAFLESILDLINKTTQLDPNKRPTIKVFFKELEEIVNKFTMYEKIMATSSVPENSEGEEDFKEDTSLFESNSIEAGDASTKVSALRESGNLLASQIINHREKGQDSETRNLSHSQVKVIKHHPVIRSLSLENGLLEGILAKDGNEASDYDRKVLNIVTLSKDAISDEEDINSPASDEEDPKSTTEERPNPLTKAGIWTTTQDSSSDDDNAELRENPSRVSSISIFNNGQQQRESQVKEKNSSPTAEYKQS